MFKIVKGLVPLGLQKADARLPNPDNTAFQNIYFVFSFLFPHLYTFFFSTLSYAEKIIQDKKKPA